IGVIIPREGRPGPVQSPTLHHHRLFGAALHLTREAVNPELSELRGKFRIRHFRDVFGEFWRRGRMHAAIGERTPFIIMTTGASMLDSYFPLLVKLAAMASIASVLARFNSFKSLLIADSRTLRQRAGLSLWLAAAFGASVAIRVLSDSQNYPAADLGLEGSLIAGILGGYVTGLFSGILISLPAMFPKGELLTMPLFAAVGLLGGVLRDL